MAEEDDGSHPRYRLSFIISAFKPAWRLPFVHAPPARDSPQIESYREGDAGTSAGEGVDVTSHSLLSWGCPVVRGNHRAMTSMDGVSQPSSALFLYHRCTEPISYCRFACVIGRKHRKGLPCGDVITVLPPQRCADTRLTQFLPIFYHLTYYDQGSHRVLFRNYSRKKSEMRRIVILATQGRSRLRVLPKILGLALRWVASINLERKNKIRSFLSKFAPQE